VLFRTRILLASRMTSLDQGMFTIAHPWLGRPDFGWLCNSGSTVFRIFRQFGKVFGAIGSLCSIGILLKSPILIDSVNFQSPSEARKSVRVRAGSGVIWRMDHLSEWHDFNPADRSTYPKVTSLTQVRDASGATAEGNFLKLVSSARRGLKPMITGWRYIRDKRIK
jgi:hypothetical protein